MIKKSGLAYRSMAILGMIFCLIYINRAVYDVVYADYIRLVNSYVPDVWNPSKFFVPDILTRIPLNYLARAINVSWFGYSTIFDMILGVLSLGASAMVLGRYYQKEQLSFPWFLGIIVVIFSLNKWEMLTNGTAWIHSLAFACFYYHYLVIDRALIKMDSEYYDHYRLLILPWLITLGVAGPYCAIYSVVVICAYLWGFFKNRQKQYFLYIISAIIPLILYIISDRMAEPVPIGTTQDSLFVGFSKNPLYFFKFFIASFSSMIMGGEVAEVYAREYQSTIFIYGLGSLVILGYLGALIANIKFRFYEKTLLPLILIVSGGLNHLLILVSRWRFESIFYGMSSRYALQFQAGIIGIFITVALIFKYCQKNKIVKVLGLSFVSVILIGNLHTSLKEWDKAVYRKNSLVELSEIALNYQDATDEQLARFQYSNRERLMNALKILEENHLNVFKEK